MTPNSTYSATRPAMSTWSWMGGRPPGRRKSSTRTLRVQGSASGIRYRTTPNTTASAMTRRYGRTYARNRLRLRPRGRCGLASSLPVLDLSTNDGVHHPGPGDRVLRDGHDVAGQHRDVRQLARRDRPLEIFLERRVRVVERVALQRLLPRHLLLREEERPVDGLPGHRRVEAGDGAHILYGCVRAIGDHGARRHQVPPHIGAFPGPLLADALGHPGPVGGRVDRLHGRDDAQAGKARLVRRIDVLRVLDAPAEVPLSRVSLERRLVDVQHLAIGAIANGVGVQLIPVLDG